MSKLSIMVEFWRFLRTAGRWWLIPLMVTLLLFGGLVLLTKGAALSPWLYALF